LAHWRECGSQIADLAALRPYGPRDAFRVTRDFPDLASRTVLVHAPRHCATGIALARSYQAVGSGSFDEPRDSARGRHRRYLRIVVRSRSARSQRQRHSPFAHPSCGSRGARSSWEIREIS
jgi:hypothetical protein